MNAGFDTLEFRVKYFDLLNQCGSNRLNRPSLKPSTGNSCNVFFPFMVVETEGFFCDSCSASRPIIKVAQVNCQ